MVWAGWATLFRYLGLQDNEFQLEYHSHWHTHTRGVTEWFCGPYLGIFIPEKGKQCRHVHRSAELGNALTQFSFTALRGCFFSLTSVTLIRYYSFVLISTSLDKHLQPRTNVYLLRVGDSSRLAQMVHVHQNFVFSWCCSCSMWVKTHHVFVEK